MTFRILNKDPLYDYREDYKITKGIELGASTGEVLNFKPKDETEYWIKQIVANHSTLRCVHFRLIDTRPKSVINQIIRATKGHPQPEVESSRPDWTGKERSFDPYEDKLFAQDHTAESFIEMAKQRMCSHTENRTRAFMYEMVAALRSSDEPFLRAVGYCCKPACAWLGGQCPELKGCGRCPSAATASISQYRLDYNLTKAEGPDEKAE